VDVFIGKGLNSIMPDRIYLGKSDNGADDKYRLADGTTVVETNNESSVFKGSLDTQSTPEPNPPVSNEFESKLYGDDLSKDTRLLYFPRDLFQTKEYAFGMRFDIFDTGGATLDSNRKRNNDAMASLDKAYAELKQQREAGNGVSATTYGKALLQGGNAALQTQISQITNVTGSQVKKRDFQRDANGNVTGVGTMRDSKEEEVTGLVGLTEKKESIYLYLPSNISFNSQMDYESADLGAIDIVKALQALGGIDNPDGMGEIAKKLSLQMLSVADEVADSLGGKELFQNYNKASKREIVNPFLVHLFKGVQRRKFKYEFSFTPRSPQEAKSVDMIVRKFRQYSHPKRSRDGRFLDFPAEFDITFLFNNEEIIRVPKIRKCALTGIDVKYGEQKFFSGFKLASTDGKSTVVHPTLVRMSLDFEELSILTREEIDRGY
jgi:hypothetical protein